MASYDIYYGKSNVAVYRTYAKPMTGLTLIPESSFAGRNNILFAADVAVRVFGDNFLPAYTEGDNRTVVATDTMKNFILQETLDFPGATLESLLAFLGQRFLSTYPQMESLRMSGTQLPFPAANAPTDMGTIVPSELLFASDRNDAASAELTIERAGDGITVRDHRCSLGEMRLVKVTGSAFADFDRDTYTTLPERPDRLLYIFLNCSWRYNDPDQMLSDNLAHYVPAEQVRDLLQTVFHSFVSMSIQHLMHEIGTRMLERFPQLSEVSFEGQNRLWDSGFVSAQDEKIKTYCDPRPPYGHLGLTMKRDG